MQEHRVVVRTLFVLIFNTNYYLWQVSLIDVIQNLLCYGCESYLFLDGIPSKPP